MYKSHEYFTCNLFGGVVMKIKSDVNRNNDLPLVGS